MNKRKKISHGVYEMPQNTKNKKKKSKRKIALVMSGGGMRCAYGAGALLAIAEYYKFKEPDILIAASGSAAPAAYYLCGQEHLGAVLWMSSVTDPKFISFTQRPIIDISYLIFTICKKNHPLNLKILKKKKTKLLYPVTRVRDGETIYLSPPPTLKLYEYLHAATAIPFGYGKKVRIKNEAYFDGDFASTIDDLARKAVDEGATDIVIIESNPRRTKSKSRRLVMGGFYIKGMIFGEEGISKASARELETHRPFIPPHGVHSIVIEPSKRLSMHFLQRKKLNLRTAFNLGYEDAANNKELAKLLR